MIAPYEGVVRTRKEVNALFPNLAEYVMCDGSFCVDATDPNSCVARFVNDPYNVATKTPNAFFLVFENKKKPTFWLVASADIAKGDEILARYGDEYWLNNLKKK